MRLPVIQGVIDRRLLINYRVDPDVLQRVLPPPFRPQLVGDWGIAGVCLIRFRDLRPRGCPAACGFSSENAAHRIAVQWDENGTTRTGVYVLRRQTNSRFNAWAGGRLFPGCHELVKFTSNEAAGCFRVQITDQAGKADFSVAARAAPHWPTTSVFADLDAASQFFAGGAQGYSLARNGTLQEGLELSCHNWRAVPLAIEQASSRYFETRTMFPPGSIELDCGLLMRDIEHQWRSLPDIHCPAA